uniref:Protein-S-isoprenylcysteine O-methyltransferase n=1 Tax=Spongospora subterranea TaxID=70186 RepID=A0A0H5RD04_9EUKA|eukprot:CRZ06398.1 hypothetical protein [Spongospora subterranea]
MGLRSLRDQLDGSVRPEHIIAGAALIGAAFGGAGVAYVLGPASIGPLSLYVILLSFFHLSEFVTTAIFNPDTLSFDSSLLNHSFEYLIAHSAAMSEYIIETCLFGAGSWKMSRLLLFSGLIICIIGQCFRTIAMCQAGTNFSHVIATMKEEKHVLVTSGVYSVVRHPSYFGFFWFTMGAQILLGNPLCMVVFALCLWKYFTQRIEYEEYLLINFFGEQYQQYRTRVPSCIPLLF